jgi:protein-tyrosine phosphatase
VIDQVALVLDDGPGRGAPSPTVVRIDGDSWEVVREGAFAAETLQRLSCRMVVFVCTGNTCRSPLAEGLCKKLLSGHLGCRPEELPRRGFIVLSAGIAAMMGGGAAAEAVEAARELGADLEGHSSRPLTADLVAQADLLVCMARGHLLALADHFPHLGPRLRLLSPGGEDVPDPIGCDRPVYQECARQILRSLELLLPEVLEL